MSLFLTVLLIYLIGLLAGNLGGRRLGRAFESVILRIPVVNWVYGSARQLLDAFSMRGGSTFSKVVMLQYPRVARRSRPGISSNVQKWWIQRGFFHRTSRMKRSNSLCHAAALSFKLTTSGAQKFAKK